MPRLCLSDDKSVHFKGIDVDASLLYPTPIASYLENQVSNRPLMLHALAALGLAVSAPSVAVAAQSGSATTPAAPVTRSTLSGQLDASFKRLDSNSDKSLSAAEIDAVQKRQIAEAQGVIAKKLEAEFTQLDANKDGQLSLAEFKAAAPTPKTATPAEVLGQMDKNKDGKVTQDEFRSVPLANFDRIDTNKDGTISEAEKTAASKR